MIAYICPLWWLSGAAWPLEESAGGGAADMGLVPDTIPALPPLRPLASAIERGAVSREDAGQQCTVAGPLVVVGGGGRVLRFDLPFCLIVTQCTFLWGWDSVVGPVMRDLGAAGTFLGLPHSASSWG